MLSDWYKDNRTSRSGAKEAYNMPRQPQSGADETGAKVEREG